MRFNYLEVNQHRIATSFKIYVKFYLNREQADATASFGSRLLNFLANLHTKRSITYLKGDGGEK